jgi:hypothetical protein
MEIPNMPPEPSEMSVLHLELQRLISSYPEPHFPRFFLPNY